MFAITPRLTNDYSLLNMMDDLIDPFYRQRNNPLIHFPDGTTGMANGRLGDSQIQSTDKEYRIRLDLGHYRPEEVKITSDSEQVTIHAKHEERQDGHGFVSREMRRTYKLPNNIDSSSATSTMNDSGTLYIRLAKKALETPKETTIPIEFKN